MWFTGVLDFLSTVIVATTAMFVLNHPLSLVYTNFDQPDPSAGFILMYLTNSNISECTWLTRTTDPIGRGRLEPLGVLVFSVIMITSFVQVAITAVQRLFGPSQAVVNVGPIAIGIMASTIVVKGACYFWCRLIRNSSVQALAEDALTDG